MRKIYAIITILAFTFGISCNAQTVSGQVGGHDYVDLGLPSGTLWAACNVGANKPTENGDYFAWGETKPKKKYSCETYKYTVGYEELNGRYTYTGFSKYNFKYRQQGNTIVHDQGDTLTSLVSEDDAATANWGLDWRIPSHIELQELIDNCTWEWTDNFNGSRVTGRIGTSKINGNTIFLPAVGYRVNGRYEQYSYLGFYWSSSLSKSSSGSSGCLRFDSNMIMVDHVSRYYGRSVRAVVKDK